MRLIIIGLIAAALVLGGGAAYLAKSYLSSQQSEMEANAPKEPTKNVMVSASNLAAGTVITRNNVTWVEWPEDAVPDGMLIEDDEPLKTLTESKHVVRRAIPKGEPITMTKLFSEESTGFMPGSLAPGMRAVALKVSADTGAAGFILPGNHVDVVLTHSMVRTAMDKNRKLLEESGGIGAHGLIAVQHAAETILTNIRVVAVDQNVDEFEGGASLANTVLLEVTPRQMVTLGVARNMGKLSLGLRSLEEPEGKVKPIYVSDVAASSMLSVIERILGGGKAPTKAAPTASTRAAPAPTTTRRTAPSSDSITIYRGGQ